MAPIVLLTPTMPTENQQRDIEKLNGLLRGELSAVETYAQCIDKMDEPALQQKLSTLRASHVIRATKLETQVRQLGGEAETSSGPWGTFAKLVQGGAKLFGKSAAISALEEGEDHGKKKYADLEGLTPATRAFVLTELVPEQARTHDALNLLQKAV